MKSAARTSGKEPSERLGGSSRQDSAKNREKVEGVTQIPMSDWIKALRSNALISNARYLELQANDAQKHERLLRLHQLCPEVPLPQMRVLPNASRQTLRKTLQQFAGMLVNIRIVDDHDNTRRRHGLTAKQAERYFQGGLSMVRSYCVTLSEFVQPKISGTIISRADALIVEIVRGAHLHLTQQSALPKHHGFFLNGRMTYDTDDAELRRNMWHAVSFIRTDYAKHGLHAPPMFCLGYFEFVASAIGRTVFTDFSQHNLFTSLP